MNRPPHPQPQHTVLSKASRLEQFTAPAPATPKRPKAPSRKQPPRHKRPSQKLSTVPQPGHTNLLLQPFQKMSQQLRPMLEIHMPLQTQKSAVRSTAPNKELSRAPKRDYLQLWSQQGLSLRSSRPWLGRVRVMPLGGRAKVWRNSQVV